MIFDKKKFLFSQRLSPISTLRTPKENNHFLGTPKYNLITKAMEWKKNVTTTLIVMVF